LEPIVGNYWQLLSKKKQPLAATHEKANRPRRWI